MYQVARDCQTIEQVLAELQRLAPSDKEYQHGLADDLLRRALELVGRQDVADAFEAQRLVIGFWYA